LGVGVGVGVVVIGGVVLGGGWLVVGGGGVVDGGELVVDGGVLCDVVGVGDGVRQCGFCGCRAHPAWPPVCAEDIIGVAAIAKPITVRTAASPSSARMRSLTGTSVTEAPVWRATYA
jgi:hypothetical protein